MRPFGPLRGREEVLATALGVGDPTEETGPLTISEGERITDLVRKGR